ncbi:MAG TPA: hypothetical protein VGX68_08325 [Thermoanaerobaculia bacterium]|nr:hypothetical protein [Thermoanaerobaculia bacterium]
MKRISIIVLAFLFALPLCAADRTIVNGLDLWQTPGDGTTFADFAKEPLPAGFFCPGSAPFTGRVILKGVPIAADRPGALGPADTIIQRLDNATFKRNVATTRIQMRAMQFEGVAPVKTSCGDFAVKVTLDGEQPITTMRIVRDSAKGGRFFAPIFVNVKISFAPADRSTTEALEIRKELRFPPAKNQRWSAPPANAHLATEGVLKVDTDSDNVPDTFLPGTTNFLAGRPNVVSRLEVQKAIQQVDDCPGGCHCADDCGIHCPVTVYPY